jgi:hypothetical protein
VACLREQKIINLSSPFGAIRDVRVLILAHGARGAATEAKSQVEVEAKTSVAAEADAEAEARTQAEFKPKLKMNLKLKLRTWLGCCDDGPAEVGAQ